MVNQQKILEEEEDTSAEEIENEEEDNKLKEKVVGLKQYMKKSSEVVLANLQVCANLFTIFTILVTMN